MKIRSCRIPRRRPEPPLTHVKIALWVMLVWLAAAGVVLFINVPWP